MKSIARPAARRRRPAWSTAVLAAGAGVTVVGLAAGLAQADAGAPIAPQRPAPMAPAETTPPAPPTQLTEKLTATLDPNRPQLNPSLLDLAPAAAPPAPPSCSVENVTNTGPYNGHDVWNIEVTVANFGVGTLWFTISGVVSTDSSAQQSNKYDGPQPHAFTVSISVPHNPPDGWSGGPETLKVMSLDWNTVAQCGFSTPAPTGS